MTLFQSLLNRSFSLMAFTGLILASWGLVVTPEEIQSTAAEPSITLSGHWGAKWGEKLGAKWSAQLAAADTPSDSVLQTSWSP